jgi:hypothetical protein
MQSMRARLLPRAAVAAAGAIAVLGLAGPPAMAEPTGGANQFCDAYCPSGVGLPSGNGVGDGAAVGRPAAGTVGNADSKYPPGQAPDGSDDNNGYECDGNEGIGQTNPAHSGCNIGS